LRAVEKRFLLMFNQINFLSFVYFLIENLLPTKQKRNKQASKQAREKEPKAASEQTKKMDLNKISEDMLTPMRVEEVEGGVAQTMDVEPMEIDHVDKAVAKERCSICMCYGHDASHSKFHPKGGEIIDQREMLHDELSGLSRDDLSRIVVVEGIPASREEGVVRNDLIHILMNHFQVQPNQVARLPKSEVFWKVAICNCFFVTIVCLFDVFCFVLFV